MASIAVIEAIELMEELEKIKGYWDDKGLDMHIAVKKDGQIAVSTKHWVRVHYLRAEGTALKEMWQNINAVAKQVGRSLVKSKQGPYVYIPKLGVEQTQNIFNAIRSKMGEHTISKKFEFSWDIDDAVLEEFLR